MQLINVKDMDTNRTTMTCVVGPGGVGEATVVDGVLFGKVEAESSP